MNGMLHKAMGMLKSRATKGMPGPMAQPKAPSASGGGLMALRNRIRRPAAGGPMVMKRPPMEPDGDEMA